ncbi:polysaccharide biosynthesis protein [Methylophilaceae bacterium]|jgi:FlaA1/EpsC-like NDP-sugar epimerase|nr:polysaccharide biosynthesis protein [Methylophilaceae bacterium]
MNKQIKNLIINNRNLIVFTHDLFVICSAWISAYIIRFNFVVPEDQFISMISNLGTVVFVQAILFLYLRIHRASWRHSSIIDIRTISAGVFYSTLVLAGYFTFYYDHQPVIPRSIILLNPLLLILFMFGSRIIYRGLREYKEYDFSSIKPKNAIILGTSKEGVSLVKTLSRNPNWRILGLLGSDISLKGREVSGVKILGAIELLPKLYKKLKIETAIIAMPSSDFEERRIALNIIKNLDLELLTIPNFEDLSSGRLSVSQIRQVDVEDLLGRDAVNLDNSDLKKLIQNDIVMISGAGGSIGSELTRQVLKFKPKIALCVDISEAALYQLEQSIHDPSKTKILFVVADIKNEKRMKDLLGRNKPSVVLHAAAYKHVPLMETENVAEVLINNAKGTFLLAKICKSLNVNKFVLISTDKAINPTNVMGASKRLAEILCQTLQSKTGTEFIIVRFGNVLGSSGSVIPLFKKQIEMGGPVTVTHRDITRYFMSIPEASQLVLQASMMGLGGEIFVLEMGKPIKILDLAKDMIKLSGLHKDEIKIIFTGLRPGEKLFEELLANHEFTKPTKHKKIRIAVTTKLKQKFSNKAIIKWINYSSDMNEAKIKKELKRWVKDYKSTR